MGLSGRGSLEALPEIIMEVENDPLDDQDSEMVRDNVALGI